MNKNELPNLLEDNIEDDNEKKEIIKFLKTLLEDFLDEVPEEIINGYDKKKNYKVRNNWFTAVIAQLDMVSDQYLSPVEDKKLIEDIDSFVIYCTSDDFHKAERHTSEEVDKANRLLEQVLELLEK